MIGYELFDSDGFGQVARLVDVAAAAHGDVVGEQLQRNDFEQRHQKFRRGRQLDEVVRRFAGEMIVLR